MTAPASQRRPRAGPPRPARLAVDLAMAGLLAASLCFRQTGRPAHEWLGLAMAAAACLHLAAVRRRPIGLPGAGGPAAVVELALAAALAAAVVTGAMNSRHVFGLSASAGGETSRRLHVLAAYWVLALAGVHVGLRWGAARAALRGMLKGRGPERRRRRRGAASAAAAALAAAGLWAFIDRDMAPKLFLGYSFDYWDSVRPPWLLPAENLAILCLYAVAARGLRKVLTRFRGRGVPPRREAPSGSPGDAGRAPGAGRP